MTESRRHELRTIVAVLLSVTFIPFANLFYWLPYYFMGKGWRAFYEFGGYVAFWFINPAVGFGAGIFHFGFQASSNFKWLAVTSWTCLALMLIGFMISGFADLS